MTSEGHVASEIRERFDSIYKYLAIIFCAGLRFRGIGGRDTGQKASFPQCLSTTCSRERTGLRHRPWASTRSVLSLRQLLSILVTLTMIPVGYIATTYLAGPRCYIPPYADHVSAHCRQWLLPLAPSLRRVHSIKHK
eukprot:COSAG02_NODE_4588_length_5186_cov_12.818361_9_plen_137_part_00